MSAHTSAPKSGVDEIIEKVSGVARSLIDWVVLIVMLILPGLIDNYIIVYAIIVALGVLFMGINGYRYSIGDIKVFPKVFEIGVFMINLAILIFLGAANPSNDWASKWTSVISSSALCGLAVISIAIRKPFTIQMAMEKVPEKIWTTPTFMWVNDCISAVWALEFALSVMFNLLYIFVYPGNSTAKVVPGIVVLILALQFTTKFPAYVRSQALSTQESTSQAEIESPGSSLSSQKV
jgi:hypothetical protein